MSLTIDQILAEAKGEIESSPQVFDLEKEASAQPSVSSHQDFSVEEIEKMAGLLREADISIAANDNSDVSVHEKIAEAMILSQTLSALNAAEEQEEKLASFRDAALQAGYNPQEVEEFVEKQAKMNMMGALKSPVGKGIAATMALGGAGAIGHEVGEERTKKKARKAIKHYSQKAYSAGAKRGYRAGTRRGFVAGAKASTAYHRRRLREMRANKG